MPGEQDTIQLNGYEFTLLNKSTTDGKTILRFLINGTGENQNDLSRWFLEVCPDSSAESGGRVEMVSCHKKVGGGEQVPARYDKTIRLPDAQSHLMGIQIDEPVGREIGDASVEFILELNRPLHPCGIHLGCQAGENIYHAQSPVSVGGTLDRNMPAPRGKENADCRNVKVPFCTYMVIPEGFIPDEKHDCMKALILCDTTNLYEESETRHCSVETPCGGIGCDIPIKKTKIVGCIKVHITVEIISTGGDGKKTTSCTCDCVYLDNVLRYASMDEKPLCPSDIRLHIPEESLKMEMLNCCQNKKLYEVQGKLTIEIHHGKCKIDA